MRRPSAPRPKRNGEAMPSRADEDSLIEEGQKRGANDLRPAPVLLEYVLQAHGTPARLSGYTAVSSVSSARAGTTVKMTLPSSSVVVSTV